MIPLIETLQEEFEQIITQKDEKTPRFYEFPGALTG